MPIHQHLLTEVGADFGEKLVICLNSFIHYQMAASDSNLRNYRYGMINARLCGMEFPEILREF